jgi:hypothetical protein
MFGNEDSKRPVRMRQRPSKLKDRKKTSLEAVLDRVAAFKAKISEESIEEDDTEEEEQPLPDSRISKDVSDDVSSPLQSPVNGQDTDGDYLE